MQDNIGNNVLLIGSGLMAQAYAKVLESLKINYDVVGRGSLSAETFGKQFKKEVATGGINAYLEACNKKYTHAIITTGINQLTNACIALISYGVPDILTEKPGGMNLEEMQSILNLQSKSKTHVWLAYNRRFYASVLEAERLIKNDGGISSMQFEFTEWAHTIEPLSTPVEIKNIWFLANSTHVTDLAFFLGGKPSEMKSFRGGSLNWHKYSRFNGAGITEKGIPFSYFADWSAPGRWAVEVLTPENRYYFKPMETLQVQKKGSVAITPVVIDDALDKEFKPGLYRQVSAFIQGDYSRFCSMQQQVEKMKWYNQISGYESI